VFEAKSICDNTINDLKIKRNECFDKKDASNNNIKTIDKSNNELRLNIENLSVQLGSLNNYNLVERKNKLKTMAHDIKDSVNLNLSDKSFQTKLKT
jgi:hypothetical protein